MLIDPTASRDVWLLLRTKPKQEAAVMLALEAREVSGYLPRVLQAPSHSRSPRGPVPLFPSYVFAYCPARERFAAINYCPGAVGIVRFGDRIAAVEESFIEHLRAKEDGRGYLVVAQARIAPAPGSRARIVRGPLEGLEGVVERYMPARDRVRLLLAVVRGMRNVEVDASDIRCHDRRSR